MIVTWKVSPSINARVNHIRPIPHQFPRAVIDVHPGWCGPCSDVLDSFYRKIVQDVNSSSSSAGAGAGEETSGDGEGSGGPLQFLTADRQLLGAKLRALFFPSSSSSSTAKDQPAGTANSKPPVAVSAQFTMNGGSGGASNGSAGAAAVAALLESGGCQPLVLFAKGRQLVAAVQGIDTPAIAQLIQQHVGSSTS